MLTPLPPRCRRRPHPRPSSPSSHTSHSLPPPGTMPHSPLYFWGRPSHPTTSVHNRLRLMVISNHECTELPTPNTSRGCVGCARVSVWGKVWGVRGTHMQERRACPQAQIPCCDRQLFRPCGEKYGIYHVTRLHLSKWAAPVLRAPLSGETES